MLNISVSHAISDINNSKVVNVRADKTGKGYIKFDKPLTGSPASCIAGGHERHLAFDLNTLGGQGVMSLALSALATGKSIRARGTGTCDIYSVVESWDWGYVYDAN